MFNPTRILRFFEYISWATTTLGLSYAVYFYLTEMKDFKVHVVPVMSRSAAKIDDLKSFLSYDAKPYDYYDKQISARDIFSMAAAASNSASAQAQVVAGQLPANLKIVGIMLGESPQIVIEDANSQQTYFINQNETQNGIKIDHVKGGTVFLDYNGQSIGVDLKGPEINLKPSSPNPNI